MNDYNNGIPMTELPRMFVWKNAVGDKEYAFGPADMEYNLCSCDHIMFDTEEKALMYWYKNEYRKELDRIIFPEYKEMEILYREKEPSLENAYLRPRNLGFIDDWRTIYVRANYREDLFDDLDLSEEEQQTAKKIMHLDPEVIEIINDAKVIRFTMADGKHIKCNQECIPGVLIELLRENRGLFNFPDRIKEKHRKKWEERRRAQIPVGIEKVE